jgi:threonine aldolase
MEGVEGLEPAAITTNYVVFGLARRSGISLAEAQSAFLAEARSRALAFTPYPGGRVRALTHHGIERNDIERALVITREVLAELGLAPVHSGSH